MENEERLQIIWKCRRTVWTVILVTSINILAIQNLEHLFSVFSHRVLQNQLITMCYGTTVIWVQIKFKRWHTTCVTFTHDVKEVLVILHLPIMLIWRLLEHGNTTMLWLRTPKTKLPTKYKEKILKKWKTIHWWIILPEGLVKVVVKVISLLNYKQYLHDSSVTHGFETWSWLP